MNLGMSVTIQNLVGSYENGYENVDQQPDGMMRRIKCAGTSVVSWMIRHFVGTDHLMADMAAAKFTEQYITEAGIAVNGANECHVSDAQSSFSASVFMFCALDHWILSPWMIAKNQNKQQSKANAPHPTAKRLFSVRKGRAIMATHKIPAGKRNTSQKVQPQRTAITASMYSGRKGRFRSVFRPTNGANQATAGDSLRIKAEAFRRSR